MARNEFQHVRSGEPLQIPAATYNAMLDAAQANRNRRLHLAPHGAGFDSLFVYVVNTTGSTLERFSVLGLDGPSETPSQQNLHHFCNRIIFKGVKPAKKHRGKFAVLQQDAANNMVVRACIHGVTIAKVKGGSEAKYCDVKENETGWLESGGNGAEVLWSGNGDWAIIRIGSGFVIYKGKLASKCSEGASTVQIKPESGETITAGVPYPGDLKECPEGHPCRYYADGDGWTLLDIACPKET